MSTFAGGSARPYLRFPDISGDRLAFVCRGDVWTASIDGRLASRLTDSPGREYFPKFSPDGGWIAFTAETSGSPQVWVAPAAGGDPRQVTFYPARDGDYYDDSFPSKIGFDHQVVGWSADSQRILFRSARKGVGWWTASFFEVSRTGGLPMPLPLAEGGTLSSDPSGSRLAFTRSTKEFNLSESWKGYRGGMAPDVWVFDPESTKLVRLTHSPATDHHPVWTSKGLYFLSDTAGTANLFRADPGELPPRQVTFEDTWDLRWASTDGRNIVLQRAGDLLLFDPDTETTEPLQLNVPCEAQTRSPDASRFVQSISVTNDGRVAIAARGEIFVIENGEAELLHHRPASRERDVSWSADGSQLAWIGDDDDRETLWISGADGQDPRRLTQDDLGLLRRPVWSPDGRHIAFHSYAGQLFVVDISTGRTWPVATSEVRRIDNYAWALDGAALVWQANLDSDRSALYAYHLEHREVVPLSDPRFSDFNPAVTRDGDVVFVSKRHFEPLVGWLEYDYTLHDLDELYVIGRRSLERALERPEDHPRNAVPPAVRAGRVAVAHGALSDLRAGDQALFYRRESTLSDLTPGLYGSSLENPGEVLLSGTIDSVALSPDGRTMVATRDRRLGVVRSTRGRLPDPDTIEWLEPELALPPEDPRLEWRQIVREAWRWQRALHYFVDAPIDWQGLLAKHLPLVDRARDRDDVNDILGELIAELGIGHLFARGGDLGRGGVSETGGVLGLELQPAAGGRYRVATIYGTGTLIIDGVRSPWSAEDSRLEVGDYLLAIDDVPLSQPTNPYSLLADRGGEIVELSFASGSSPGESWKESIEVLASEAPLRYSDWLEHNRKTVLEATAGQAGYLHIPNFGKHGLAIFAQQYYSERRRAALIVDTRFADGGYLAEAILERLTRRPTRA